MAKDIGKIKQKVVKVLKENGVKRAGIFGSYARGEQKDNSDVDILAEFDKSLSLLDIIGIEIELKKKLKKKVDLVEYVSLHHLLKNKILNEEVRII